MLFKLSDPFVHTIIEMKDKMREHRTIVESEAQESEKPTLNSKKEIKSKSSVLGNNAIKRRIFSDFIKCIKLIIATM